MHERPPTSSQLLDVMCVRREGWRLRLLYFALLPSYGHTCYTASSQPVRPKRFALSSGGASLNTAREQQRRMLTKRPRQPPTALRVDLRN